MRDLFHDLFIPEHVDDADLLKRMKILCPVSHALLQEGKRFISPNQSTRDLASRFTGYLEEQWHGKYSLEHIHINVNSCAFHCMPGDLKLLPGDILTVDIVLSDSRVFSDGAWTYLVGDTSSERQALVQRAWDVSLRAIQSVRPGDGFSVMQKNLLNDFDWNDFSLVPGACGHGVGRQVHDEPEIPFFFNKKNSGIWRENLICTIEPVVIDGDSNVIECKDLSYSSESGADSAYFEHVIFVGPEEVICLNIPEINITECIDIF